MPCLRSICLLIFVSNSAPAGDWPQWLGPNRDGASSEKIAAWKETPKVLWRQPAGEGHSSPVVSGGRVYFHAKVRDKDAEEVVALDAATGKEVWRIPYPRGPFSNPFGNGPRATPVVAGNCIFTFGVTGLLTCFDTTSGKQLWQVDTRSDFHAPGLLFGASCSPLLAGDNVLVNVGSKEASIVAFQKDTGKVAWKSQDDLSSYSSPIRIGEGGAEQVVFLTGSRLLGLKPADGALLWDFPLKDDLFESSTTPIRAGDMLIAASITFGSVGLNLETKDNKPSVREIWKNRALTCYFSTPVAVGKEHVYMVTGVVPSPFQKKKPEATLRCIEAATGKELWSKPNIGTYHASLIRTGDDKLLLLDDAGNLILLEPSAKEYRELARSAVCGKTWAHPALAEGRIYVRDEKELICLELAGQ
jgi:outer membrane protein assembly factor BamB